MPGSIIAMARLGRPSIMVYGGTIRAGRSKSGKPLDIVSAFQRHGQFIVRNIDEEERKNIFRHACPGPGACVGMYTANTMDSAIRALRMSGRARMSHSYATGASPAAHTASLSATSAPRPKRAVRSHCCRAATRSTSTPESACWRWMSTMLSSSAGAYRGRCHHTSTLVASSASTSRA